MDRWVGKVAVVTGASSGVGAATAKRLVKEGLIVVGLARGSETIDEYAKELQREKGKLYSVKVDLRNENEILEAFKWIKENVGPLHVLVNCAGIWRASPLRNGDTQKWRDVLDVNVLALCITSREAIKDMTANNVEGHIIHINSVGGHRPGMPGSNVSGASKYCVTALTDALRVELNTVGSKIRISSVSPGFVRTKIFETTFKDRGTEVPEALQEYLNSDKILLPEDLADAIVYILGTPQRVQIHDMIMLPHGGGTVGMKD